MSSAYDLAQQAQRLAADPATNVFVTANAGSGKTKVLIDRIARLLLAGAQPSSFLCITYTKAAAAEMQRRLFERLGEWCVASDENLQAALQELEAPEGALPRARALFARALETPGGLRIQTIHAFCERLLARFPLEADAPPGFDIADEARAAALMNKARARLLSADDVQAAEAFTRFATKLDAGRLDALIGKLVEQAVLFAGMDGETIAARHRARGAAEAIIADALASAPWADWTTAAGTLAASTPANQKCGALIMAAHALREGEAAAAWAGYSAIFLTQDGKPRAKPITDAIRKAEPFLDRLFEEAGAAFHEACAAVRAAERAADAAAALTLGRTLAEAYAAAKAQAGVLDFADLIAQARALLTKSGAAAWVLYKLDGRIDHILVDEGQDTSPDQWALVAPLQEEFFAGAGGVTRERTVFAVGDPKQSIYSFQGAEPARFREEGRALDLRAHAAGRAFSAPSLDMSFRSTAQVLQAVDAAFEGLEIVDAAPEAFDVMRHTVRREGETGLVEAWPIAPRPQARAAAPWDAPLDMEQAEAAHVVLAREIARTVKRWIVEGHAVWDKGALRPMRAGDVLALVRARGPVFQALIKAFKREGLPVAGADRMVLRDELAVEDCLALMRVALDPGDDLSLACVLKGPWLNLVDDDRDLFPLAHGRAKGERLLDRLMAQRDARYTRARAFVSDLIARAGLDAFAFLSWALETPYEDGRSGWARVFARLGQEARDPLAELLERALHPGREAAPTLQRFLADSEGDAVYVKREMEEAC
ncbi:MAG: UvrD-helicase domain-containing protein, partial [Hyphomonadaceae bacterium]